MLMATVAITCIEAQQLTYGKYMEKVFANNTALTAKQLDTDIAQAKIEHSKVYNDPEFGIEYGNNEDWELDLGQSISAELSRTFTFGVRKAGIAVAKREKDETAAMLNEYIRILHAEATIAYLEHLKAKALLQYTIGNEKFMQQLATGDSLRFIRGDIAKSVWTETRMAANLAHNERLSAETASRCTAITLGYYMGNMQNAHLIETGEKLDGTFTGKAKPLDTCIEEAIVHRADLKAALMRVDVAEAIKRFNSAQRRTNMRITVGAEYNDATPSFTKVKAGVAMPIKFSNLNKGARAMDRIMVEQAEKEAIDARLQIECEVMQAYDNYRTAEQQAATYTNELLAEADELIDGKRKAYKTGDISFVEFIEAERSRNIMQVAYIEALFNKAVQWVELQKSIGCRIVFE